MLQRSAMLTLAAIASIGFAVTTTGAMAKPIIKPFPKPIVKPIIKPIFVPHWPHHPRWHRPYVRIITPMVVERTTTPVTTGPARTPRRVCLTKEYLPTGAVLFKDVCTQEWAQNPPDQEQPPQGPQAQTQNGK